MRGATSFSAASLLQQSDFNPRSSCEERPLQRLRPGLSQSNFNPRSSCEGRHQRMDIMNDVLEFQSTLLMRGATRADDEGFINNAFQSTLLMRGATASIDTAQRAIQFQSTLLMRGATLDCQYHQCRVVLFQSTLLMRGATAASSAGATAAENFNPRSSCEERHVHSFFSGLFL